VNQNDLDIETIVIPDEEGNEVEFEVYMKFDVEDTGHKYMILIPLDDDEEMEEDDEVVAFRYEEEGEEYTLYFIEDEAEWEVVEATFETLQQELMSEEEE
jgi:uncharacterized protein YrzB (UPF0473 family)